MRLLILQWAMMALHVGAFAFQLWLIRKLSRERAVVRAQRAASEPKIVRRTTIQFTSKADMQRFIHKLIETHAELDDNDDALTLMVDGSRPSERSEAK